MSVLLMAVPSVAKPVGGLSEMAISQLLHLLGSGLAASAAKGRSDKESKPEEKPKAETPKEEPKQEEKKYRSGGYVRSADGCAQRGKTRGRMV